MTKPLETPLLTELHALLHQPEPDIETFLEKLRASRPNQRASPRSSFYRFLCGALLAIPTPTSPEDFVPKLLESIATFGDDDRRTRVLRVFSRDALGILATASTLETFRSSMVWDFGLFDPYELSTPTIGSSLSAYHLLRLTTSQQRAAINLMKSHPIVRQDIGEDIAEHMGWFLAAARALEEVLCQREPRAYARELSARFGGHLVYHARWGLFVEGLMIRCRLPGGRTTVALLDGRVEVWWDDASRLQEHEHTLPRYRRRGD